MLKFSLSLVAVWGMIFGLYYVYPGFDGLFVVALILSVVLISWFFKSGSVSVEIGGDSQVDKISDDGTADGGGDGGDGGGD